MISVGTVIREYKIEELLGGGSMGRVYRALDQELKRHVAIKVIRPELAGEADFVERFRTEAMAMGSLNHANVVTVYGLFREGGELYLVMEFIPGRPLDKVLLEEGPMPWPRAHLLFVGALAGIEQAHDRDIVHRDIKPGNLLLTDLESIKVMDFGIARMAGAGLRTRTGYLVGTLEYMAPEQVLGQGVDARTDIYALGIVLYQMLTGRVPFKAESDFELMRMQIEHPPPPPMKHVPNLPPAVNNAILRALAKKPDERFQTVGELRAALVSTGAPLTAADAPTLVKPRVPAETKPQPPMPPTKQPPRPPPVPPPVKTAVREAVPATVVSRPQAPPAWRTFGVVAGVGLAAVIAFLLISRRGDEINERPGVTTSLPASTSVRVAGSTSVAPVVTTPDTTTVVSARDTTTVLVRPSSTSTLARSTSSATRTTTSSIASSTVTTSQRPAVAIPEFKAVFECRHGVKFNVDPEEAMVGILNPEEGPAVKEIGVADDWDGRPRPYTFEKPGTYYARFTLAGYRTAWVKIVVGPGAKDAIADVDTELEEN